MMLALGLDTSGPVGSVALVGGDGTNGAEVLGHERIDRGMKHGVELFPSLARLLEAAGVGPRELDLVAVGTGPGSYTGLRVGVTAARGLAYAADAALLGVPSCDAWARSVSPSEGTLAVVLDAHVRAVYFALYECDDPERGWTRREEPSVLAPPDAAARLPEGVTLVGDGAAAYPEHLAAFEQRTSPDHVEAAEVARIALRRHAGGERVPLEDVVPLYLAKSKGGPSP